MPKQSPSDPKFRCNICEEYYFAPEYKIHYQCPVHGYLCSKHVGDEEIIVYMHGPENPNDFPDIDLHPKDDPYYDQVINPVSNRIEKCIVDMKSEFDYNEYGGHIYAYDSISKFGEKFKLNQDACLKNLLKFTWSEKVNRWIEEGRETEEEFFKKVQNNDNDLSIKNSDILLLLDLFEKDILSKEQFIQQLKQKI